MEKEERLKIEVLPDKVLIGQDLTKAYQNVKKIEPKKYLEKEYINTVLESMPSTRDKMLIMFMWVTGLRVSEVNKIRKEDIDFKNKTMAVRWLKSRRFTTRIVPLHPQIIDVLQLYVVQLKHDDIIFSYTRQRIYDITMYWLKCSPHQLRHSFAVNFLRQSSSPQALVILQKLLGHKRIQTTMEYLKIVPSDQALELSKITF